MSFKEKNTKNYSDFDFYIAENEERYNEYASVNSGMSADEIVWRVNNNLDKEKYQLIEEISNCDDICVLVNKYFKLPDSYIPSDLIESDGIVMKNVVAESFIKMHDEALKYGYPLKVTSAYRPIEEQRHIYNEKLLNEKKEDVDAFCARPGHSEHHTGLAIDVEWPVPDGVELGDDIISHWVKENCHRYGFIVRYLPETVEITGYASEPWHLRYIGVEASTDMKEKNINSFEEYRERFLRIKK